MSDVVNVPSDAVATDNDDVPVGAAVATLLDANPHRKSALIVNTGVNPMRVTTDGSDPTPTHGKPVPAGGLLSLSSPHCPTEEVKATRQGAADTTANASEVS
jgi:hypothetical protein